MFIAYINTSCSAGPLLNPNRVARLPSSFQGSIPNVTKEIIEAIIECSYKKREAFSCIHKGGGNITIETSYNGKLLKRSLTTVDRKAQFWQVIDDFLAELGCCDNLVTKDNGNCIQCRGGGSGVTPKNKKRSRSKNDVVTEPIAKKKKTKAKGYPSVNQHKLRSLTVAIETIPAKLLQPFLKQLELRTQSSEHSQTCTSSTSQVSKSQGLKLSLPTNSSPTVVSPNYSRSPYKILFPGSLPGNLSPPSSPEAGIMKELFPALIPEGSLVSEDAEDNDIASTSSAGACFSPQAGSSAELDGTSSPGSIRSPVSDIFPSTKSRKVRRRISSSTDDVSSPGTSKTPLTDLYAQLVVAHGGTPYGSDSMESAETLVRPDDAVKPNDEPHGTLYGSDSMVTHGGTPYGRDSMESAGTLVRPDDAVKPNDGSHGTPYGSDSMESAGTLVRPDDAVKPNDEPHGRESSSSSGQSGEGPGETETEDAAIDNTTQAVNPTNEKAVTDVTISELQQKNEMLEKQTRKLKGYVKHLAKKQGISALSQLGDIPMVGTPLNIPLDDNDDYDEDYIPNEDDYYDDVLDDEDSLPDIVEDYIPNEDDYDGNVLNDNADIDALPDLVDEDDYDGKVLNDNADIDALPDLVDKDDYDGKVLNDNVDVDALSDLVDEDDIPNDDKGDDYDDLVTTSEDVDDNTTIGGSQDDATVEGTAMETADASISPILRSNNEADSTVVIHEADNQASDSLSEMETGDRYISQSTESLAFAPSLYGSGDGSSQEDRNAENKEEAVISDSPEGMRRSEHATTTTEKRNNVPCIIIDAETSDAVGGVASSDMSAFNELGPISSITNIGPSAPSIYGQHSPGNSNINSLGAQGGTISGVAGHGVAQNQGVGGLWGVNAPPIYRGGSNGHGVPQSAAVAQTAPSPITGLPQGQAIQHGQRRDSFGVQYTSSAAEQEAALNSQMIQLAREVRQQQMAARLQQQAITANGANSQMLTAPQRQQTNSTPVNATSNPQVGALLGIQQAIALYGSPQQKAHLVNILRKNSSQGAPPYPLNISAASNQQVTPLTTPLRSNSTQFTRASIPTENSAANAAPRVLQDSAVLMQGGYPVLQGSYPVPRGSYPAPGNISTAVRDSYMRMGQGVSRQGVSRHQGMPFLNQAAWNRMNVYPSNTMNNASANVTGMQRTNVNAPPVFVGSSNNTGNVNTAYGVGIQAHNLPASTTVIFSQPQLASQQNPYPINLATRVNPQLIQRRNSNVSPLLQTQNVPAQTAVTFSQGIQRRTSSVSPAAQTNVYEAGNSTNPGNVRVPSVLGTMSSVNGYTQAVAPTVANTISSGSTLLPSGRRVSYDESVNITQAQGSTQAARHGRETPQESSNVVQALVSPAQRIPSTAHSPGSAAVLVQSQSPAAATSSSSTNVQSQHPNTPENRIPPPPLGPVATTLQLKAHALGTPGGRIPLPTATVKKFNNDFVMLWDMTIDANSPTICLYELYGLQLTEGETIVGESLWKMVGVMKALPLPMACTLTHLSPGRRSFFVVRAVAEGGIYGPFSRLCQAFEPQS